MPDDSNLIDQYRKTQSNYFTDSVRSFAIAHSGTFRCETGHLLSASELPFPEFPPVEERHNGLMKLLKITSQCYTLSKNLAKYKFGPSYIAFKTPVTNIRRERQLEGIAAAKQRGAYSGRKKKIDDKEIQRLHFEKKIYACRIRTLFNK
jgi:hypothetical protein